MACREAEGVKEAEAKDLVVPGSKGVAWLGKKVRLGYWQRILPILQLDKTIFILA
jgi:hypothetical protein